MSYSFTYILFWKHLKNIVAYSMDGLLILIYILFLSWKQLIRWHNVCQLCGINKYIDCLMILVMTLFLRFLFIYNDIWILNMNILLIFLKSFGYKSFSFSEPFFPSKTLCMTWFFLVSRWISWKSFKDESYSKHWHLTRKLSLKTGTNCILTCSIRILWHKSQTNGI